MGGIGLGSIGEFLYIESREKAWVPSRTYRKRTFVDRSSTLSNSVTVMR
jgi:hypothetical protein